jgi:ribonuclease P protein component
MADTRGETPIEIQASPRAKPARLTTLKKRPEFLRVRGGGRWATAAFVLEGKPRDGRAVAETPRFGFTVSKQVGNAAERNRIRRRLKAAVRDVLLEQSRRDYDYVLIARRPALDAAFAALVSDLAEALKRVHARGLKAERGQTAKRQERKGTMNPDGARAGSAADAKGSGRQ